MKAVRRSKYEDYGRNNYEEELKWNCSTVKKKTHLTRVRHNEEKSKLKFELQEAKPILIHGRICKVMLWYW